MIRSIGQRYRLYAQISRLQPHTQALHQSTQSVSLLGLPWSIMGKVRKHSRTSKLVTTSFGDPSKTSRKVLKNLTDKLVGSQTVKFKAKTGDTLENPSSSKQLSEKVKKIKLRKVTSKAAISIKPRFEDKIIAEEELVKVLSAENVCKPGCSKKKRKVKHVNQEGDEKLSESQTEQVKNIAKIADIVPLAVDMPEEIEASELSLSELKSASKGDVIMETSDCVSDTDSSSAILPQESDFESLDHNMDDIADIPLAVIMPIGVMNVPTEGRNDIETLPAPVENPNIKILPENEGVKSRCFDNISTNVELKASDTMSKNVPSKAVISKKMLTQSDKGLENFKVHLVGSSVLLELIHPVQFFIFGQVKVQVLRGQIQILGYEMNNKSGSKVVSSLRGSSFLSIQSVPLKHKRKNFLYVPPDLQNGDALESLIKSQNSSHIWVLFKEGNHDFLEYIRMYLEYPISLKEFKNDEVSLFSQAQEALSCIIQPEPALGKRLYESEAWKDVSQKITQEEKSCTVLCGGKGVGKSTLLRYLINQVLSNRKAAAREVIVLDFDPGQAELTPPGCLAVSLVKEPLLGPNYSHLQPPERCIFIGEISVTQCLGRYMEAAADIIRYCKESPKLSSLPCIVNTMGFTQGIGVTIMGQLLKLLRPNRVVQIESKRNRENYPFPLSTMNVLSYLNSSDSRCISDSLQLSPSEKVDLNYEFILLQSAAEAKSSRDVNVWGMTPRVSRNAAILSYFSSLVLPPNYSILEDIPFSCPLGSLFLCVAHEQVPPSLILSAINGNMVALCSIDPHTSDVLCHQDPSMPRVLTKVPIAPCIGFGIVRGVDMDARILYLTTPLREEKLSLVNCLIFGAVNLPPSVYIKSTAPGLVPYVSTGHHPELSTQQ